MPALLILSLFAFVLYTGNDGNDIEAAENKLEETLQLFVDRNIDDYAENVKNERFSSPEEARSNYIEVVMYDPTHDFEILEMIERSENRAVFSVKIELDTVFLVEPYEMIYEDNEWLLLISEEDLKVDEYEIVEYK